MELAKLTAKESFQNEMLEDFDNESQYFESGLNLERKNGTEKSLKIGDSIPIDQAKFENHYNKISQLK